MALFRSDASPLHDRTVVTPSVREIAPDGRAPFDSLGLIGTSEVIRRLCDDLDFAAGSDAKVLLTGETGVGKEVAANAIHRRSRRCEAPFVTINCAGVPDSLLESELFGHVRGSFTGAVRDSPGLLRQGHRGTVFLDEVGEMSPRMQGLLLRFLETGELQTVGGTATHAHVDVRIIAATNRDLTTSVAGGRFREDLFYRLNVLGIRIAPLRERQADIPTLLRHYATHYARIHRKQAPCWTPAALELLVHYPWPGNVRELRNVVERTVLRLSSGAIRPTDLPADVCGVAPLPVPSPAAAPTPARVRGDLLVQQMLATKDSFWTVVYASFMARDLTREDVRHVVTLGLERTHGSYRSLLPLYNMAPDDYKRFLGFLKQHDCHVPFQGFRANPRMLRLPLDRPSSQATV